MITIIPIAGYLFGIYFVLVPYWILNTTTNCRVLEGHVSQEIEHFVRANEGNVASMSSAEYELNLNLLHEKNVLNSFRKVKIIKELSPKRHCVISRL